MLPRSQNAGFLTWKNNWGSAAWSWEDAEGTQTAWFSAEAQVLPRNPTTAPGQAFAPLSWLMWPPLAPLIQSSCAEQPDSKGAA